MKNVSVSCLVLSAFFCLDLSNSVSHGETTSGPPIIESYSYGWSNNGNFDDFTFGVSIDPNGASTSAHIEFGQSYALGEVSEEILFITHSSEILNIDSLPINTIFYFKIVASNSFGTTVSDLDSFGTTSTLPPPGAITLQPDSITRSSVVLHGLCKSNDHALFAYFMVQTGDGTMGTVLGPFSIEPRSSDTLLTANWTGLLPGSEYRYALSVRYVNQLGAPPSSRGEFVSFTTEPDSMVLSLIIPITVSNYATILEDPTKPFMFGTKYLGVHSYGTKCMDWALGELPLPPAFPDGTIDFRFTGTCLELGVYVDIRRYESAAQTDTYRVRFYPGQESLPVVVSWPDLNESYDGKVSVLFNGEIVDMKATTSITIENSELYSLRIIAEKPNVSLRRPNVLMGKSTTTATEVHMEAVALPNGATTNVWFEWGETGYENQTSPQYVGNGVARVPIETNLSGLHGGRAYHIRAVSKSDGGTVFGEDQIFITKTIADADEDKLYARSFSLGQNYPNPFNPSTDIRFQIADRQFVSLKIYNVMGQEIATLVNEEKQPGFYSATWEASGNPSGVYYYRLSAGGFSETRKLILMK